MVVRYRGWWETVIALESGKERRGQSLNNVFPPERYIFFTPRPVRYRSNHFFHPKLQTGKGVRLNRYLFVTHPI
jgi:hypothetical protein